MTNINKSSLSFPVIFQKIEDVDVGDQRFTRVKIWLMHLGVNYNGTDFSKDVVDKALPTLQYIPIVGFITRNSVNEDDFSQHKFVEVLTANGKESKYLGQAYGVILSDDDNNAHYEDRLCDDGETRTFLVVDGIIWNMFEDGAGIINRDKIKSLSMELWQESEDSVDGYEDENGIFHVTDFSFRAACILGKDYEPAMENASIEVQDAICNYIKTIQKELSSKYTSYCKDINIKNQGGNKTLDKNNYAQTVANLFSDIANIVEDAEQINNRWGEKVPRYWFADVQDSEVIVMDSADHYNFYGFPFTVNEDKPVIDFTVPKRKKLRYEDYGDGAQTDTSLNFEKIVNDVLDASSKRIENANTEKEEALSNYEQMKTNYENLQNDFDEMKPKFDAYVEAEEAAMKEAVAAQKNALFQKFDKHLSDNSEYTQIKESADELSIDDIEAKCSILYTKKVLNTSPNTNYSKNNNVASVGIPDIDDDAVDDGYVKTKYGMIRKNI